MPIFLYTGDANLSAAQLWEVEKSGMIGVNGLAYYELPIIKYVDDWFQFFAAGTNDFINRDDFAAYNIEKFEKIKAGELDYPISVYMHHSAVLTNKRRIQTRKVFEWLRKNEEYLYFDTLENYYGQLRTKLLYQSKEVS